jgi:hypothetical protein
MQLQLNVHRLVVVYRVPALDALDAATLAVRLDRWRIGAEHAGWQFGWRDAPHYVETYCYAFAGTDFLEDEQQQLYWRTDIVQMTRYYMLEATRCGIRLSPRRAVSRLKFISAGWPHTRAHLVTLARASYEPVRRARASPAKWPLGCCSR